MPPRYPGKYPKVASPRIFELFSIDSRVEESLHVMDLLSSGLNAYDLNAFHTLGYAFCPTETITGSKSS